MNRAYKLVWNTVSGSWIVASELAKGRKRSSSTVLKLTVLLAVGFGSGTVLAAPAINALPTGESVASGSASFDRSVTNQLTVNQSTSKLITNWNSFDVGSGATVSFVQPDASSIALNRVTTGSPSQIFGQVTANGQLVIVNPNGITFAAGSQVSAASIIGSVLDISDANFNGSNYQFSRGAATGSIDNKGSITATAGSVALLAPTVKNSGSISATGGNAALINVDAVNLTAADPSISTASTITGLIQQSGSITATQVSAVGGKILLTGDTSQTASQIQLAGTLDATTNTTVNGRSIVVNGDVNLNGASNMLGLSSSNGYSLSNGAKVNLNGASSGFSVNGTAYTVIHDVDQLQAINGNLTGKYALAGNIDASATSGWNSGAGFVPIAGNGGTTSRFSGVLDGLGHTVNALSIIKAANVQAVGLIGAASTATIQNLGLTNVSFQGGWIAAPLVGAVLQGTTTIKNVYVTGTFTVPSGSTGYLGSLVGSVVGTSNGNIHISNSYSSVNINAGSVGAAYIGGLVGTISAGSNSITDSYFTGSISSQGAFVGGIYAGNLGVPSSVSLNRVYVSGALSGGANVGGLVGSAPAVLTISNSYWNTQTTGRASASGGGTGVLTNVQGLTTAQSTQLASFANWGSAIDAQGGTGAAWRIYEGKSGPLLRTFLKPLNLANTSKTYDSTAYTVTLASGFDSSKVLGTASFSGNAIGAINAGSYSQIVSGLHSMQDGYDIVDTGTLTINKASLSVSATDASKVYDGTTSASSTALITAGSLFGSDSLNGATIIFADKHAGTGKHLLVSSAQISDGNNGGNYDVTYADNTNSTINKAALVLTTTDVSKTYDGLTSAAGTAIATGATQVFNGDSISGGTFAFTNKHVGTGKTVTVSGVSVSDGNNGDNYDVTYADNTNSTINKAALVLTTTDVSKTYDGLTSAAGTAIATGATQVFTGDSISGGTFAFTDKNAGTGKTVTVSGVTVSDGNNGDNYAVTYADNTSSTINKASLSISATDASKVYDGTTSASSTAVVAGGSLFGSDSISGGNIAFANKHAGTGKHVQVTGVTVSDGNNGDNYDVTYVDNTNSSISKRQLTMSAVADTKEYDGKLTSTAMAKPVVIGRQRGDAIVGLTQSYLDKNAGTGKAINLDAGYTISDGNNGNNYDVVIVNSTAGVITPKAVTISTVANTKVYDGGVTSANKPLVTGLITGDRITGLFQQYETKTVGTGKKLLIKSGYVVQDGNSGGNYIVTEQGSNDGVITAH